jgi:hypothetical protein
MYHAELQAILSKHQLNAGAAVTGIKLLSGTAEALHACVALSGNIEESHCK